MFFFNFVVKWKVCYIANISFIFYDLFFNYSISLRHYNMNIFNSTFIYLEIVTYKLIKCNCSPILRIKLYCIKLLLIINYYMYKI